ncbi:DUF2971 domain-containing protein [Streptococcus thalassemiae]|uniref:DUF2971 domain-containing protein n=1 Tax=Streptococcus thalassemiae TaxID=2736608 RepID=UPI0020CA44BF|nr:DUF2971 domain-containing protein [Streptococcus thalassemiae]
MDEQKYNLEQSLTELDKLFDLSAKDTDKTACEALAEKARIIYEQYPESEDIAVRYAKTLFYLSTKQIVLKELETTAKKLEKLQQKFPESNDIAEALAGTLLLLSFEQTVLRELETTAEKLEKLQQKFPKSNDIALHYARFLFILSDKQTVLKELEATVEKLQGLQQKFPESHDIAEAFAKTLLLLSIKQTVLKELESTAEKLEKLQQKFPESHDIAEAFAKTLLLLSIKQTVLKELETTAEKLEKLQQKFPESHDIAGAFARTLLLLSFEQTVLNELETTAEKLQELQQKFLESPVIALQYARFSFVLLIKQTELKKIEDTVEKLEKLQQKFPKSEEIAFIYSILLASLFNHQTELDERLQTTKIIKKLYEQFSKFMLQNFDDLFFRDDNVCYREEYKLFNFILKEGLLKNTKYAILQTWAERYKENSSEIKNLLSIYQLVQKIKYQLGLKDEDKNQMLKFGHYTKGSTLQIMLNQEGNDKKDFSVSGKTRLYNANYMNDPEEGIVIEQILGLDRRDVLEPSSWFLMSFTNKTDDLAMWSQYGDDAKGVCLVLREDDFSRFTSFNDVSWRQEKNFLEFSDKMYLLKSELNSGFEKSIFRSESENSVDTVNDEGTEPNSVEKDSDSKRNSDYLYRIAYVKHTEENLKLERTELFEKSEIEELEKLLNSLKEKLDIGSKITEKNYQDAISECIEEIRYLFKSVDYKYENELRILRYANLDPSNKEIKIDKSSGVGKLYIERKNSIQIGEVIFGPKFPNPEYVTPLLKLLDENIDYKKSTIKFR